MVYPPTGSTAYEREMSTLPTLLLEYGPSLHLPLLLFLVDRDLIQLLTMLKSFLIGLEPAAWFGFHNNSGNFSETQCSRLSTCFSQSVTVSLNLQNYLSAVFCHVAGFRFH